MLSDDHDKTQACHTQRYVFFILLPVAYVNQWQQATLICISTLFVSPATLRQGDKKIV